MSNDYDEDISNIHKTAQAMLEEIRSSKGGFLEYKRHILHQLETHEQAIEALSRNIEKRIQKIESDQQIDVEKLLGEIKELRQKTEENKKFYNESIQNLIDKNHNVHLIATKAATKISIGMSIIIMILMFVIEKLGLFQ